jgi:hypothetical protein
MRAVSNTKRRGLALTRPGFALTLKHQIAMAAAFSFMLVLALLLAPGSAVAGISGQLGSAWSPPAQLSGHELLELNQVGVDPSDGSVFVANSDTEFEETIIRKFSPTGTFEASVALPGRAYQGIAVDPNLNRFYVIKDGSTFEAEKILAFSTTPSGTSLVPATTSELPAHATGAPLLKPQEVVVDPSTDDLVIVGMEEKAGKEFTALQRIDVDPLTGVGTVGDRFTDEEEPLAEGAVKRAIAIDAAGVTYLVSSGNRPPEAQSLPAGFTASSSLTPVPGFAAAHTSGELQGILINRGVNKPNFGPQVTVSTSAGGEDTLYWKFQADSNNMLIEGYSVGSESRAPGVFGEGAAAGECFIYAPSAALAAEEDGDVAVVDQGSIIGEAGEMPEAFPSVYQFGPGGTKCPAPAPAFKLESEGHTVSSVQSGSAGATVAFNAAETELNGASLGGAIWKVQGPEGFSESITGSNLALSHKFVAPGNYTVRLIIKAADGTLGSAFSTQPHTLQVTADPNVSAPTVTGVTPGEGATTGGSKVKITGTNLTGATVVKFGSVGVTCKETEATCKVVGNTEIVATSPVLPVGAVDVHVLNGAGESPTNAPADQFTAAVPPTVTGISPDEGPASGGTAVTITGSNFIGVTELKFGSAAVVCAGTTATCKVESDTEIKATTPAVPGGTVDVRALAGTVESPVDAPADHFVSIPGKVSLTITKAGSGAGTVSSSPGGINCGSACSASFNEGTSVTLTASPASGSAFAGWEGSCSGAAATCVVAMSAATTVTATFDANPPAAGDNPPAGENKPPASGGNPPAEVKPTPVVTKPKPKTKAEILAAQRKAALKKCQKLKGKAKAMCVKKADQIGKPKKKTKKVKGKGGKSARVEARQD